MRRPTTRLLAIAALGLPLFSWSCDRPEGPLGSSPFGPERAVIDGGTADGYTLVETRLPPLQSVLQVSKLISVNGGSLSLAGHTLTVPAGAVSSLTLFTMTLGLNGYVEVSLTATASSLLGGVVDVGETGFRKPVTLSLSYAWASNITDPSRLVNVWLRGSGYDVADVLPSTVDTAQELVHSPLDHFSRYAMASN